MRLAILCSGQAGQSREMLDGAFADPACAPLLATASTVLGEDIERWWRGLDEAALFANEHAQFAIVLAQLARWRQLAPLLPTPALVAGYSLGELTAWCIAGALDEATTLQLARTRARLMSAAAPAGEGGCMVLWRGRVAPAVARAKEAAQQRLGLSLAIARRRGEEVLAGSPAAVAAFVADPAIVNPELVRLPVSIPSHSPLLAEAAEAFGELLRLSPLREPAIAVLAGIDGQAVRHRAGAIDTLARQIAAPVRWDRCMETLAESGIDRALELGPGHDLARLLETEYPGIAARALEEFGSPAGAATWVAA